MIDSLSPLARLALAYAPARAREDWLTLLVLDARLAAVVREAREPVLAQIRLAWWRERLKDSPEARPKGEPLLARIGDWPGLDRLADGWEEMLAEQPSFPGFAEGRAGAIASLAAKLGVSDPSAGILARRWAFADLALHLGDGEERTLALALLAGTKPPKNRASHVLRPLAVLSSLSVRAAEQGRAVLTGPLDLPTAIRIGLFGG